MRRLSPYVTAMALRTGLPANGVTALMIASGVAAAYLFALPPLWAAIGGVILVQAHLLFDCSDGEVARITATTSPSGIYLDRLGHYVIDASLFVAYGVRAADGEVGYVVLGAVCAALVLIAKASGDLVAVARAQSGLTKLEDDLPAEPGRLAGARSIASKFPLHRATGAIESSIIVMLAATIDTTSQTLDATRAALWGLFLIAALVVPIRIYANMASSRLR